MNKKLCFIAILHVNIEQIFVDFNSARFEPVLCSKYLARCCVLSVHEVHF
jgi:hypothetical protein